MNPQTGEFSVIKMLDYEAGRFYLFNVIVTVVLHFPNDLKVATTTDLVYTYRTEVVWREQFK